MNSKEWIVSFLYCAAAVALTVFMFRYPWFENMNQSIVLLSGYALTVIINLLIINNIDDSDMREDYRYSDLRIYFSYEQIRNTFYVLIVLFSPLNLLCEILNYIFDRQQD